jgi:hypothetical protein
MRRCLKGLGGHPTSTDGFILGPSHGTVGRLAFLLDDNVGRTLLSASFLTLVLILHLISRFARVSIRSSQLPSVSC